MAGARLSLAERRYIVGGAEVGVRGDGRGRLDRREFSVQTGVIAQANGSARVLWDATNILVGIKAEIAEPARDTPAQGALLCSVDCAAIASQAFEGRGADEINAELGTVLQKALSQPSAFDLAALSIYPGVQCWNLYLDALVLDFGGNLVDALLLASRAALADLRLPNVTVRNPDSESPDIEISDDPDDVRAFSVATVPVGVTLSRLGRSFVVDATPAEEHCCDASVHVTVTSAGQVSLVQKGGPGSLYAGSLVEMIAAGTKLGVALARDLDAQLAIPATHRQNLAASWREWGA